tara:strand:- start:153 stop:329 length:177 start_codon:yes stop_codon:yes gene_type:complete
MNIYKENGYKNRAEYFEALAFDYDIDINSVHALADVLGSNEDFDGLIYAINDYINMGL